MLFKILKGDSSRISTDITPFHEGWAYFTPDDGGFFIDTKNDSGAESRVRVVGDGASECSGGTAIYGTLYADAWGNNSHQRLSVAGLRADQNGVIGVTHDITDEQMKACGNGGLYVCEQGDGYLVIALNGDTPPCNIPVVVILLG